LSVSLVTRSACGLASVPTRVRIGVDLGGTKINLLDPDVIVLGGGMSNLARLYAAVPRLWTRWVFSDRVDTRLVPPAHGDASGVRGAAWLWEPGEAP
jgi:predicted NBD/HSP70 family sugar kinase